MSIPSIPTFSTRWCFMPVFWGVWALLTPRTWMPERLPLWGAILGALARGNALFVLNMPQRIVGQPVPLAPRVVEAAVAIGVYYLLWMVVRAVYRALRGPELAEKEFRTAA